MKSLLFLGAGTSMPLGFPSGSKLKELIFSKIGNENYRKLRRIEELGYTQEDLNYLMEIGRWGRFGTIDELLGVKDQFSTLGRYLITEILKPFENREGVLGSNDWYWSLFQKLKPYLDKPIKDSLAIISLNYDRTFELFFSEIPKFHLKESEVANAINNLTSIEIIHPHGMMGKFPGEPFKDDNDFNVYRRISEGIKIVHDDFSESDEVKRCYELIAECGRIYFMGFGYHKITLDLFFPKGSLEGKEVKGTGYKMGEDARDAATRFLKNAGASKPEIFGNRQCNEFVDSITLDFNHDQATL